MKRPFIFLILITGVFIALRLYGFPHYSLFRGDQGLDMLTLWSMEHTQFHPLTGAPLSVPTITVPPTFFYLMWLFYKTTGTYVGVYAGTFLLALGTFLILVRLAWKIGGAVSGLLAALLIAVSRVYIFQAINLWDPIPGIFFLSLSLFTLYHAHKQRNMFFLWAGVCCFACSVSLYPGPIILLPLLFWFVFWWYRNIWKAAVTIICSFLPFFIPELFAGNIRNFFSLNGLIVQSEIAGLHWIQSLSLLAQNLLVFMQAAVPASLGIAIVAFACLFWCTAAYLTHRNRKFPTGAVLTGFLGMPALTLYRGPANDHRLWGYLPVMVLLAALSVPFSLRQKGPTRYVAFVFLSLYCITNISALRLYFRHPLQQFSHTERIAALIAMDMRTRRITPTEVSYSYVRQSHMDNYELYSIWYWLEQSHGIPVPFYADGSVNTTRRTEASAFYRICEGSCIPTMALPGTLVTAHYGVGGYSLYVLERIHQTP